MSMTGDVAVAMARETCSKIEDKKETREEKHWNWNCSPNPAESLWLWPPSDFVFYLK